MLKIGASIFSRLINDDVLKAVKESGLTSIEISNGRFDGFNDFDYKGVKKSADNMGVELWSLHLPFVPFDVIEISSLDSNIQKYTFDTFVDIIKKASDIGIDKFIIHPSGEPIDDNDRQDRLNSSAQFLSRLADEADRCGAVIAIEDLPRTCLGRNSEEMKYLLSANNKLRVCFDTNHLLGEDIVDFIKNVGDKIITTHISDYDFVNERHWIPGEGDIDWLELYNALKEVNYKGVWLYETGLRPPKSIIRRDLTYKDLYENANQIFNNINPTPIGKRIENLGFWV